MAAAAVIERRSPIQSRADVTPPPTHPLLHEPAVAQKPQSRTWKRGWGTLNLEKYD